MAFEFPPGGEGPVRLRESIIASEAPNAAEMLEGELAINSADGKLFFRKPNGTLGTLIAGVSSVNGKTGAVTLTYSDVAAAPLGHTHTASEVGMPSIVIGALTTTYGASSSDYYDVPSLSLNLTQSGVWDVRVVLVGASTSASSGGAYVTLNGTSYVGSTTPVGYASYGGSDLVGNTAQAASANASGAISASFVYATTVASTLAVRLNTANQPDNAHIVPGSHVIAIRCGDVSS